MPELRKQPNEAPQKRGDRMSDIPITIGSKWRHPNGMIYEVICIANYPMGEPGSFYKLVIYSSGLKNEIFWALPFEKWHEIMTAHVMVFLNTKGTTGLDNQREVPSF